MEVLAGDEATLVTSPRPRLSVLDLVPISSGSTARQALENTVDLARRTEAAGYHRYWIAEHHLNPGVAGTQPALVIGLVAAATQRIRVGSGAVQMGHATPLAVVEQFGLLDAVYPGRIDLALGRSGLRRPDDAGRVSDHATPEHAGYRTARGLVVPPPYSFARLLGSPRIALQAALLQQPGAETPLYGQQLDDVQALLAGTYAAPDGTEAHVVPGEGADVEVWILGSSGGTSARQAGARGLPFATNYHVAPAGVLEAVEAYRSAFRPSEVLRQPYVAVSADVVVADTHTDARELAAGYGLWVRSIRTAQGAIPFPTPAEARAHVWSDADRELVQDRLDTQFVGDPHSVADQLEILAAETGADELIVTTITHDHADRTRSYDMLAGEWARRDRVPQLARS